VQEKKPAAVKKEPTAKAKKSAVKKVSSQHAARCGGL
jgi:hypothetical protein